MIRSLTFFKIEIGSIVLLFEGQALPHASEQRLPTSSLVYRLLTGAADGASAGQAGGDRQTEEKERRCWLSLYSILRRSKKMLRKAELNRPGFGGGSNS